MTKNLNAAIDKNMEFLLMYATSVFKQYFFLLVREDDRKDQKNLSFEQVFVTRM